jgi:hypothetical protein
MIENCFEGVVREDGAHGRGGVGKYPRFRMGNSCHVRERGPQVRKTCPGGGTSRSPDTCLRRFRPHFCPDKGGRLERTGARTASGGCVGPLAGLVKIDDLLIVRIPVKLST